MDVFCKTCDKVLGNIPDEKIPPNTKKYAVCHTCGERILLFRKVEESPFTNNTYLEVGDEELPSCQPEQSPPSREKIETKPETGESIILKPLFLGKAGEYFRIWIVNTFLTILTLGIYAAWAKVRTRRYFYSHTSIDGHAFDYLANPVAILKGNLIVGAGLILYSAADFAGPEIKLAMAALIAIIFPFLIYKSLRFYAHNSSFRNIRFHFSGKLKESYFIYLLIPILIPFTAALILPYWAYRRKAFFFNNFAFGSTGSNFKGKVFPFYNIYLFALLLSALSIAAVASLILGVGLDPLLSLINATMNSADEGKLPGNFEKMMVLSIFASYVIMLFFITVIQQYTFVRLTNYCWHHARLGKIYFKSDIKVGRLIWIRITNILAILCSIGLLAPWAKIRRTRYIIGNLSLVAYCSLDDFSTAMVEEESAVGDSATDFFDFEIGL